MNSASPPFDCPTRNLLGWPLVHLDFESCLDGLERMIEMGETETVFTPNVDHLRVVKIDEAANAAFRSATWLLPDGQPLMWAARWLGRPLAEKLSGSDLFDPLMKRVAASGQPVYFVGGAPGTAQEAIGVLGKRHGPLNIVGFESPPLGFENDETYCRGLAARISGARPRLLVGCMGTPKTEKWIVRWRDRLDTGLAVSFGAAIDFTTGRAKRAPRWMQKAGLEWSWRLMREPRRMYKRYLVRDPGFFLDVAQQWASERKARALGEKGRRKI